MYRMALDPENPATEVYVILRVYNLGLSAPLVVICGKHEAIQKSIGWPFFKL